MGTKMNDELTQIGTFMLRVSSQGQSQESDAVKSTSPDTFACRS